MCCETIDVLQRPDQMIALTSDTALLWVQAVDALLQDYLQIEVCLRCSAQRLLAVRDVFSFAIKMVMYPMAPLFDKTEQSLRPLCIKALLRVFNMCDADQVLNCTAPLLCVLHSESALVKCMAGQRWSSAWRVSAGQVHGGSALVKCSKCLLQHVESLTPPAGRRAERRGAQRLPSAVLQPAAAEGRAADAQGRG